MGTRFSLFSREAERALGLGNGGGLLSYRTPPQPWAPSCFPSSNSQWALSCAQDDMARGFLNLLKEGERGLG